MSGMSIFLNKNYYLVHKEKHIVYRITSIYDKSNSFAGTEMRALCVDDASGEIRDYPLHDLHPTDKDSEMLIRLMVGITHE